MPEAPAPAATREELLEELAGYGVDATELEGDADLADLSNVELERIVVSIAGAVKRARDAAASAPVPLITAIAYAMGEAGQVSKTGVNKDQGYKFASAEAILAAVRGPLLNRGVILLAHPRSYKTSEIVSRSGTKGELIEIALDFVFRDGAGAELRVDDWRGIGQDYGDKALGKAYTNAVKTFVRTNWLLPTEHDDPEASDPGERVATPDVPAWARDASRPRKEALLDFLEPLLGRPVARELALAVKSDLGVVPDVLVTFAGAIRSRMAIVVDGAPAPDGPSPEPDDEADAALAAAAAAAAEAGDIDEDVPPDAGLPPDDEPPPVDDRPPAGSVEVDLDGITAPARKIAALQAAGCICSSPLGPSDQADGSCPISGHGIPF